jgi:hypothetical protein
VNGAKLGYNEDSRAPVAASRYAQARLPFPKYFDPTRNFPYFVDKFVDWEIDFSKLAVAASFNSVGFQMNPSKSDCEAALAKIPEAEVIAISILAAGHLKPAEAATYLRTLPTISGAMTMTSRRLISEILCSPCAQFSFNGPCNTDFIPLRM